MQAPVNSGSSFFNYKGTHSIVLLAVCDAHYRFTLVDIGDNGHHSDGGVLTTSDFGQALENGALSIPSDRPLTGTTRPNLPYVFVDDKAFPLKMNMLRPYPGKNLPEPEAIFNCDRICKNPACREKLRSNIVKVQFLSYSCQRTFLLTVTIAYGG